MTFGEQNTEAEGHAMMDYCRECGVNFFDTAEIYPVKPSAATQGATSRIVGSWLKGKPRDELMIASKVAGRSVGMPWVPANRTDPPGAEETPVVSGAAIRAACEGELRRLGSDYLDLFQIHWPDRYVPLFGLSQYHADSERDAVPFQEQVEAMGQLIAEGKVRYWGLSNETTFGATTFCATAAALGVPQPISIQNSYSLIHRSFEEQLAEACSPHNLNLGLLPWSAMAGGALSGKYLGGEQPDGTRMTRWPDRYKRFITPRVFEAVAEYARIAEQAGLTPAQLAYAFCRSRWFVPTTLMGATTMEQLRENLLAFSSPLGDDVLAAIDEVHVRNRNPSVMD